MLMKAFGTVIGAAMLLASSVHAQTAHDFKFTSIDGEAMPLSDYAGKAVLVVNTASRCGFTDQYSDLQSLWADYRDQGLVVLGVPSNDFGGQEPGAESEIKKFCEVNFDVDFPLTSKTVVQGRDAHPFYRWARETLGDDARPKWNFHKFLVGADGTLLAWFPSRDRPLSDAVKNAVVEALPKAEG